MIHAVLIEALFSSGFDTQLQDLGMWVTVITGYTEIIVQGRADPPWWQQCHQAVSFITFPNTVPTVLALLGVLPGVIAEIVSCPNCGPEVSFFQSSNLLLSPQCRATACSGTCFQVYLLGSLESFESKAIFRVSRKGTRLHSSFNIVSVPVEMALGDSTGPFADAGSHGDHPL